MGSTMSKKVFARAFFATTILLSQTMVQAFDTSVKGFIALDLANFEKIEGKKAKTVVGIGVLDLKVFAEQEGLTFNMKLDLDGKIAEENNIFEEAYVGYRGIRDWRFLAGKGVVRFQSIHWGVAENSYLDGGSVLGTENSWRKQSKKAYVAVAYGHYSKGFLNTFSFFGNSSEIKTDEDGNPYYETTTGSNNKTFVKGYTYEPVTAFDTDKQLGFANKFELYPTQAVTLTNGLILTRNKFTGKSSWAVDFTLRYEPGAYEIWAELLHGYTSTAPYERYSTYRKRETYAQFGGEYFLNQDWSLLANTEGLIVEDQAHSYPSFMYRGREYVRDSGIRKVNSKFDTIQYKIESGVKYKISKSSQITFAALWENKIVEKDNVKDLKRIDGVYDPNRQAFKLSTALSYWF